jgi:hypothetical protein
LRGGRAVIRHDSGADRNPDELSVRAGANLLFDPIVIVVHGLETQIERSRDFGIRGPDRDLSKDLGLAGSKRIEDRTAADPLGRDVSGDLRRERPPAAGNRPYRRGEFGRISALQDIADRTSFKGFQGETGAAVH